MDHEYKFTMSLRTKLLDEIKEYWGKNVLNCSAHNTKQKNTFKNNQHDQYDQYDKCNQHYIHNNTKAKHKHLSEPTDKKKKRAKNAFLKQKHSKEHRSRNKMSKFVDKHHLVKSFKDQCIEKKIENLYFKAYANQFGPFDRFLGDDTRDIFFYDHNLHRTIFGYDSDDDMSDYSYDYSYDSDDDYQYMNNYDNVSDYIEYFKKQAQIKEKITNYYNEKKYREIYKFVDAKTTIIKPKIVDITCSVCWTATSNIKLKCSHEYCDECFSYNYFVMDAPKYCALCRSDICGFVTTQLEFTLLDK